MKSKVWYTFECANCGEFDLKLSPTVDNLSKQKCPVCKTLSIRKYTLAGITFKGSGFHVNDYKSGQPSGTG